ncbi:MAG TPA: UBP-type zinc finger domain-containing protein [Candidatus Sulfotelmatobacter sp.]|nr:UBP-type zinc finger domain-containing protein [Candidatus Sulfotelmatobacter sp.]
MAVCAHLDEIRQVTPSAEGCEDCLRTGGRWLHLRLCMTCGHVGCCDSSPNKHATKHYHATKHPIIRSFEPGEDWAWCYDDEVMLDPTGWAVKGPIAHPV